MVEKLNQLLTAFEGSLSEKNLQAEVLNLKSEYLGKNGHISEILKSLKDVSLEEKKVLGPLANEIKEKINELTAKKLNDLEIAEFNKKLTEDKIDITNRESLQANGVKSGAFILPGLSKKRSKIFFNPWVLKYWMVPISKMNFIISRH